MCSHFSDTVSSTVWVDRLASPNRKIQNPVDVINFKSQTDQPLTTEPAIESIHVSTMAMLPPLMRSMRLLKGCSTTTTIARRASSQAQWTAPATNRHREARRKRVPPVDKKEEDFDRQQGEFVRSLFNTEKHGVRISKNVYTNYYCGRCKNYVTYRCLQQSVVYV
jgi:hypothetical protein